MAKFLIAAAVGTALGFLAGIGTGGGSLLIIWLTAVIGHTPQEARGINLLFFLPGALIATYLRKKQRVLSLRQLSPAIVAGCCSAAACSLLGQQLDTEILRKLFGWLLIAAGIREILYKPK